MPSKSSAKRNKSEVVSIRLRAEQLQRLQRFAKRLGNTASEAAALLVEEGLRRTQFAFIDFRSSSGGRQAYLQNSRVTVWQAVMIAKTYKMDVDKTAEHLQCPTVRIQSALNYYSAFPGEIEESIEENADYGLDKLQQMLPQIQAFTVESSNIVAEPHEDQFNKVNISSASRATRKKQLPGKKRTRRQ